MDIWWSVMHAMNGTTQLVKKLIKIFWRNNVAHGIAQVAQVVNSTFFCVKIIIQPY